jgi:thiol-disulfide isomerase/thioredoxin
MDATQVTGTAVALCVLGLATLVGLGWRRRNGRLRAVESPQGQRDDAAILRTLGVRPGAVTLLQFSSAFCAPCRVARRVCAEVANSLDGVNHIEVDAESHLAEVRRLDIWRTPTVLIVDVAGRVAQRASGAPAKAQVLAAVTPLLAVRA